MTSIAHRYTDFSSLETDGRQSEHIPLEQVEDQKLQSFEDGYQAGWNDAEKNLVAEQKSATDEILHNLRDLSFTYQEARDQLQRSLSPMFDQLLKSLLPRTASAALRAHTIEQLIEISAGKTGSSLTVRVSEADLPVFEDMLDEADPKLSVTVTTDPTLKPHQLFVSSDQIEKEINLDAVCLEITEAMQAFNFHSKSEQPDD